jgi:nucleoside-triphosphatase THEP1
MILSAIGVSLLVGGQFLWKEKRIVWRAGLVCALMKSISPSAVILGPMVGIFSEAIILELFIRLSRGTTVGLLIGGAVAVCLPFIQSIVSLIITYGFNIAALYIELYKIIVKHIGIRGIDIYGAIGIFVSLNALFGIAAALLGIKIGKHAVASEHQKIGQAPQDATPLSLPLVNSTQRFSLILLFINIVLVPIILFTTGWIGLAWSILIVGFYIVVMFGLYPNAWRRFSRAKLWIEMILITVISGFLLGEITSKQSGWNWSGIIIGLEMSVRAAFMVVAFNVVSVELRNPKIVDWIMRRGFGQLASAMEAAFDALPTMIAVLGEQRNVLRHPVTSLSRLLLVAKRRVIEIESEITDGAKVILLTGARGSGKTTLLREFVEGCRKKSIPVAGILSPAVWIDSKRIGYDVLDIHSGERRSLCRIGPNGSGPKVGEFNFLEDGIQFGNEILGSASPKVSALVIIDEIGPLELNGNVWASSVDQLMKQTVTPVLLVVREQLIEKVSSRWNFVPLAICKINENNSDEIANQIRNIITKTNNHSRFNK